MVVIVLGQQGRMRPRYSQRGAVSCRHGGYLQEPLLHADRLNLLRADRLGVPAVQEQNYADGDQLRFC